MRPETVLALKPGGDPKAAAAQWVAAYAAAARECPADKALCDRLTRRAEDACALCCERAAYVPSPCHDEAYYTAFAEAREREDAALDGGFPLGNEADAAFAGDYFSVPELVQLQCGRAQRIDAGTFNGYNFDVLVRRGFLAEAAGDFAEAARCYGGVSTSRSVQEREYAYVKCNGNCEATEDKFVYIGTGSCAAVEKFYNGKGKCTSGCHGLGDCVKVCENNAICIKNGVAVINPELCTACGKCVKVCPNKLISLIGESQKFIVRCSSTDPGKITRAACKNGCIGCGICAKKCPVGAIAVNANHAVIDAGKCIGCGTCAQACPMKCIAKI